MNGPPFTGRGLVSLPDRGIATFVVQVPQDSQYELIIRYQVRQFTVFLFQDVSLPAGQMDCDWRLILMTVLIFHQHSCMHTLKATMQVDGVTFRISTLNNEPVNLDFNCAPTNGTVFRFLGPASLVPGQRYHRFDSVCLDSTARYEVTVEYNTLAGTTQWLLDSVSGSQSVV